ncbi:sulfite exporter TauE/SafE family protein [Formosa algae]|uniref:Probable membrane transporter protein n=1 Tax=Formosa algae TaxID=225843 RepID=A0A9X1CCE8_9FLAO|nr:sulfite exporter TauE/SafE family protein [Formosa algae]MBP1840170.1 putative membrane protein YfcA [Formosa algae]MDQ0335770.1 putative membrane protein YfcA [Formosa algae]OEI81013.1 permease [Formosa algae]
MDISQIIGFIGALIVGLVLGLTGGGGSILTVPILVYLLMLNPVTATAYSLFIVGVSSSFGAFKNFQKGLVDLKIAAVFAIPAFTMVYITRKFIIPAIPDAIFSIGSFVVTKDIFIMVMFAVMMVIASLTMLKPKKDDSKEHAHSKLSNLLIFNQAIVIGFFTGIVGAGGGFIIIPALIILGNLSMKKAVGTSLFIIAVNSLIGFIGDIGNIEIDWVFLLSFTAVAVVGIFLGSYFSNFISGKKLKKGFGWFVLIMGVYIIIKELIM